MSDTPNPPQGSPEPTPEPTPATPAVPDAQPAAGGALPESAGATPLTPDAADVEKNKVMALLSYIGILWLVPLLAAKDSPYAKFHCNQGILLSLGSIVICMVLGIGSIVLRFIPVINVLAACMSCIVFPIISLAILAYSILGVVNAINGKMKPLPLFPVVNWVK
jgi:uncharacterized membrane protein